MTAQSAVSALNTPFKATLFLRMLERLQSGAMKLTLPTGDVLHFEGPRPGPRADLQVLDWQGISRILSGGDIGVAEAYRDGQINSSDMLQVLLLALANEQALDRALHGSFAGTLLYRFRHLLNRNTRRNSRRNIHAHYDIGNAFYRLWLDEGMTYSSAVFEHEDQPLEAAQTAKYDRILRALQVQPGQHILEIGCGWGAFAEYAASRYGCFVTGVSLSAEQLAWARARIPGTGAEGKVEFHFRDYRDLDGQYDAIVSIEMLEAVGEAFWPTYFSKLQSLLKPGGRAAIQTITIANERFEDYRRQTDFIQQYIFPGGMLPSPQRLDDEVARTDLRKEDLFFFGLDYAETLKRWRHAFDHHLPAIRAQGFDSAFIRLWRFYYWYCEAGFLTGRTNVCQLVLHKPASPMRRPS